MQNQSKTLILFEKWITLMIIVKTKFYCYPFIQYWIHIVSQFQPIITITNNYSQNNSWTITQLIYQIYVSFIRPEVGIFQFIGAETFFILGILVIVVHKFIMIVLLFNHQAIQQTNISNYLQILIMFAGFYQQTICKFFGISLQTMFLIMLKTNPEQYSYIIISWIFIILIQIEILAAYVITEGPLTYNISLFEKSKIPLSTIIQNFLKIISHIIYFVITNEQNEKSLIFVNSAIQIILSFTEIIEQLQEKIYIYYNAQLILFTISLFNFMFSINQIFNYTEINQNTIQYSLIMLYPSLLYMIYRINNQQQIQSFISIHQQKQQNSNNLITQFLQEINQIKQNQYVSLMNDTLIFIHHRQTCINLFCTCRQSAYLNDINKISPLTIQMKKEFYFTKLNQLMYIQYQTNKQQILGHVINHSLLMYDLGQYINTIKTINQILINHKSKSYYLVNYIIPNQTQQTKVDTNTVVQSNNSETAELKDVNINIKVQLNIITRLKLQIVINLAKKRIKDHLSQSFYKYSQNMIIEYLKKYLEFEFQMNEIKNLITEQAQIKINFYQQLIQESSYNLNKLMISTLNTCNSMVQVHQHIKQAFNNFPCFSIQRAFIYYEAEITNNFLEARKINNQTSIQDEKFLQFNSNLISKNKIGYLIIEVQNDLKTTEIKFASHEFQTIFERIYYDKKINLDDLLPQFLIKQHPIFIENFLKNGRSLYFQNFQSNFLKTQDGLIKPVKFCYDTITNHTQNEKLIFSVFFQEISESKAFLLVDELQKLTYFSITFFKKLGFQDHEIQIMKNSNILSNIKINSIIPDFDQYIEKDQNDEYKIFGVNIFFLNIFTIFNKGSFNINQNGELQNLFQKKKEQLFKFNTNIQINKHYLKDINYFIIEILYVENNTQTNLLDSFNKLDENVRYTPKSYPSISEKQQISSNGSISINNNEKINQIQVLDFIKDQFMISHSNFQIDSISQPKIQIMDPNMNFMTPNESSFDTRRKCHTKNQQDFYSQKMSQADIQALISEKRIDNYDYEQQQMKLDLQSDRSSIEDIQKKKYIKKFEFLEGLMIYKRPLKLIEILSLLTFQNIIFTIFSLIAITVMSNDLSQSLHEIDAISLHSNLMGKSDLFFTMRETITLYQIYQNLNIIQNYDNLIKPIYNNLQNGYNEYQENIYSQFQNLNLQTYIDNNHLIIYQQQNENQIININVTIREYLLIYLQYQYDLLIEYQTNQILIDSSDNTFELSNFIQIHQLLENITINVLSNSTTRSSDVANKWMIIWIFFQIGALILAIINFYCYYNYITFYDKFLQILKFIDQNVLITEIEKHKQIISMIKANSKFVFEYIINFDKIYPNQQHNTISIKQKEQLNKKIIKVRRLSSFLLIFVLNLIFGGYSLIINEKTQIYLSKYEKTAKLFKLFQDLTLSGGNCLLYKELLQNNELLQLENQTYQYNYRLGLYELLDQSLNTIQQFILQSNSIEFNDYLVTDTFISIFNNIKINNLCYYINQTYLQQYCNLSFEGVMENGLLQTLNYIINSIEIQQAINNFTNRTEYILYEQEGSQIITRIFLNMSSQFKQDLTQLSQEQTDLAFNLSIVFFIYSFIVTFCLLFYLKQHLTQEYYIIRKIINLIPINIILFDEPLDRHLREIALHQELL